jgi:hypothetical protein
VISAASGMKDSRYKRWHDDLPREVMEELLTIRASLLAGDLNVSARTLARAILDDFEKRGTRLCSLHTMNQWLLHD